MRRWHFLALLFVTLTTYYYVLDVREHVQEKFQPGLSFNYTGNEYLNYHTFGAPGKLTLIFIHGLGSSLQSWNDLKPYIASEKTRKIYLDLKGAGFSSKPKYSDYSVTAQASLLSSFITSQNIRDYVLVGHSLGGTTAIASTLQKMKYDLPTPKALILLDPAVYVSKFPFFIDSLRNPVIDGLIQFTTTSNYRARYVLERIYFDRSKVTDEKVSRYAFFMRLPGQHHALVQSAKQLTLNNHEEFLESVRTIQVPTQIIWGEQDPIIPVESGRQLLQDLPVARLHVVSGCGHNVQEECPQQVAKVINDYLAEIQGL